MSKHDDEKRRRRESSPSRRESRRSPGSRASPDDPDLPAQFGRVPDESSKDDDSNVLQRMKHAPITSPLCSLNKCISGGCQLKVWTRNYKEVRGICTGVLVAFDKHWNIIMADVDEVYLKPRKGKTPFMEEPGEESMPDLAPKVPKKKKEKTSTAADEKPVDAEEPQNAVEKKKKKKKKSSPTSHQRKVKHCFIRGDNVVMLQLVEAEAAAEED